MKKILITGINSYIGSSFEAWCSQFPGHYSVDTVDMRDGSWKEKSFAQYDSVFHVAGLAHVSKDPKLQELYYKINRDLPVETALKAKNDGVGQFIFMSSMIVYGDSGPVNVKKVINKDTVPKPADFYGNSKLQAEEGLFKLQDDNFKVLVLRPPMVYGGGSKGNYPKLSKMAQKLLIFPDIENERSMLYIDNLCEFVRLMVENEEQGIFFPQNKDYVKTSELVSLIAKAHDKKIRLTKFFNPILCSLGHNIDLINKAFGNMVYEKDMSDYKEEYRMMNLKESIITTECFFEKEQT